MLAVRRRNVCPHAAASKQCGWELAVATRFNKTMVPLEVADVSQVTLSGDIRILQLFPRKEVFNCSRRDDANALVGFLGSDALWTITYSCRSDRVHVWNKIGRNVERLLSTVEVQEAETWKQGRPPLDLELEQLVSGYIHSNRKKS